jgi:hypothetical protein
MTHGRIAQPPLALYKRRKAKSDFRAIRDQHVASWNGAHLLYFHPDHLGSTNLLTDETSVIASAITYSPDGDNTTPGTPRRLPFTRQELDRTTGL